MFSKGSRIMGPAAALVLLCFFLPWITVSCAGQPVASLSGMELATGTQLPTGENTSSPQLFLVPIAALVVLSIILMMYQRRITVRVGALGAIIVSLIGLLPIVLEFITSRSSNVAGDFGSMITITPQIGLWGVILANLAIVAGAVVDLMDYREGSVQEYQYPASIPLPPTVASPPPPISTAPPPRPIPPVPPIEQTRHIQPSPRAMAWLVVQGGSVVGKQYGLTTTGRNIVGRDGTRSDFIINDDMMSGQHAQVRFENGQYVVYDLASTNGTYVNNRRVQRQPLMDNDVVRLGNTQLVFKAVPQSRH